MTTVTRRPREKREVRQKVLWAGTFRRLHYTAAIFVAPLIAIAALTGFVYAFAPSIESAVYHNELTAESHQPAVSLERQIKAARQVYPNLPLKGVQVAGDTEVGEIPSTTTRVLFNDKSFETNNWTRAVFVDPGSLEIKGTLVQYGNASALPVRTWISVGHKRLWLGQPGRIYSAIAASWLGPLAVTGVVLWYLTRSDSQRKPGRKTRRRYAKNHSTLGLIAAPGLIFLCVSGLTWSLVAGGNIGQMRAQLDWLPTTPHTALERSYMGPTDPQADTVLTAARSAGLTGTIELNPPKDDHSGWAVNETRQPYKMANDAVAVDGQSGEIVDNVPFNSWPFAAQVAAWIIQLHMGILFGIYSQIAMGMLALVILAIVVYGYSMWFKRGRGSRPGALPRKINWERIPRWGWALLAVGTLAYAIFAPLFGVTLVAFVLMDAVVTRLKAKRTAIPNT